MSNKNNKTWTVEQSYSEDGYWPYDHYKSYEAAEKSAREQAYSSGKNHIVMAPIAVAKAPVSVNDVQIEKVT